MDEVEIEWTRAGGFMYRPGEVIARGDDAIEFMRSRFDGGSGSSSEVGEGSERLFKSVDNPLDLIDEGRSLGHDLQPNHVLVSHGGCGCGGGCGDDCCGTHPRDRELSGLAPNPFRANPFRANPFRANPFRANVLCGNPFRANPFRANAPMKNSAESVTVEEAPAGLSASSTGQARVLVLDTGLDHHPLLTDWFDGAHDEDPDTDPQDGDLDPVAGHGTFIAGLIAQSSEDVHVTVRKIVSPRGVVDEWDAVLALDAALADDFDVINMSFGGPASATINHLHSKVAAVRQAGTLLVASAGNDGSCCPQYPAAFAEVVGVGALDVDGPADFSNYGSWVNACALGVDLVSAFFTFGSYAGWARWSGTSFAAPLVTAAIASAIAGGFDREEALAAVLENPAQPEIDCLGRVVGEIQQ